MLLYVASLLRLSLYIIKRFRRRRRHVKNREGEGEGEGVGGDPEAELF